jgi:hypothetical protein
MGIYFRIQEGKMDEEETKIWMEGIWMKHASRLVPTFRLTSSLLAASK